MNIIKLLVPFSLMVLIAGCGQQEIKNLRNENLALKEKNNSLKQENIILRETDQNYFSKAIDTFNEATTKTSLQEANRSFSQLIDKFPHSPYTADAQKYIDEILIQLAIIKVMETAKAKFESALIKHKYDDASTALNVLEPLISDDEHKIYSDRLYEEKNKPLLTTINRLKSNPYDNFGIRVRFDAIFWSISRERKSLSASDRKGGGGSNIEVFYGKSNLENYFTDNDPKCCETRYTVVGETRFYNNNWEELYIRAEKITEIQQ